MSDKTKLVLALLVLLKLTLLVIGALLLKSNPQFSALLKSLFPAS